MRSLAFLSAVLLLSSLAAAAAAGAANAYVGASGGRWLGGDAQWSLEHKPRFPETAVVHHDKVVVLDGDSRSAGEVKVQGHVVVRGGEGMLVVGPKSCWDTQTKVREATASADTVCHDNVICTKDEYETSPHTATQVRSCVAHTRCGAAEWQIVAGGTHHDRECKAHTTCTATEYQTGAAGTHNDRQCKAWSTCGAAQWEAAPGGSHSDRICKDWTVCAATQWEAVAAGAHHDRECKEHTACAATQWQTRAAGTHHDRRCKPHTICEDNEYQIRAATTTSDRACASHTACTADQYESKAAGAHHDRECAVLTFCSATQWEAVAPTRSSDRVCKDHTTCTSWQWETAAAGESSDRACRDHTTCSSTQWQTRPAGTHQDRHCTDCATLPRCKPWEHRQGCGGTGTGHCTFDCSRGACYVGASGGAWFASTASWSTGRFPAYPADAGVANREVVIRNNKRARGAASLIEINEGGTIRLEGTAELGLGPRVCDASEYERSPPTTFADRVCGERVVCTATQWEVSAQTPERSRVCKDHTVCSATQWQTKAAGTHHDRTCKDDTTCTATQFEHLAKSRTSDRACTDHTVCTDPADVHAAGEYASTAAGTHHDRACQALTVCDYAHQFMSTPPAPHSDRVCTALTTCTATEYETVPKTLTSDRVCADSTVLASEQTTKRTGLWLRHAGPAEAVIAAEADGALSISASKCVVRTNFCAPHADASCPMSTTAIVSKVNFHAVDGASGVLQLHGDGTLFFNAAESEGCVGVSGPPPTNVKMTGPLGGLVIRQPDSPPANIVQVDGALTIKSKFINIVNRDASFGSFRLEPQ